MPAPRLLLLTVDRLPAWILPAYGATWVSAPAIDRLAAEGLLLDRVIATSLDPRRTLAALAGGLLGAAEEAGLDPRLVTDDDALASRESVAILVEAPVPRRRARDAAQTALGRLFAAARESVGHGHRLVWIHAGSLARVWDAPEAFDDPYVDPEDPAPPGGAAAPGLAVDADTDPDLVVGWRQRMAGQVSLLDRLLGELVSALPLDATEPWAIGLAGIRGMPLGLHGRVGSPDGADAEPPHAESIHLPTILVDPRRRMAGQRYPGLVTPADVGATIRDLLGLGAAPAEEDPADPGRSLGGLFVDWTRVERDRVVSDAEGSVSVMTSGWHWIGGAAVEAREPSRRAAEGGPPGLLHAWPDDYFERCDVADRCPEVAAGLGRIAEAALSGRAGEARRMPLP